MTVPVILDGVRYEASQFNDSFGGRVLHFVVINGDRSVIHAFRSVDDARAFVLASAGAPSGSGGRFARPLASHGCQNHVGATTSVYYPGTFCSGSPVATTTYTQAIPDLSSYGLNDAISSLGCAYDSTFTTNCVLWEHVNYGGSSLWFSAGQVHNDLSFAGWDNRASSIIHYGQSSRPSL